MVATLDRGIEIVINKNGHPTLTFVGFGLTGEQENRMLDAAGFRVTLEVWGCLRSVERDGYDARHRLLAGKTYKVVLIPGAEFGDYVRTVLTVRDYARRMYGYGEPLAGFIPKLCFSISRKKMAELGYEFIMSLHDPICVGGRPGVLTMNNAGRVGVSFCHPDGRLRKDGAFAFLESVK